MKKRAELESDKWKTHQTGIEFFLGDDRVTTIRATGNGLEVSVAGCEAPMRARRITLLEDMDWLFLDFEEGSELHRVGLKLRCIPYDELNLGLRSLVADQATPCFRRHRHLMSSHARHTAAADGDKPTD